MKKITFLIDESLNHEALQGFMARIDPLCTPMPKHKGLPERNLSDFSAWGTSPIEAVFSLVTFLTKDNHDDETWFA